MSYMKSPSRAGSDEADPPFIPLSPDEREMLDLVRSALADRRMRLAFQPAVYAVDPSIIGFYEGYIRLLDLQGRILPARDFMPVVERQELGREIDLAALDLALSALQAHPGIRIAVNMSARSIGYGPWVQKLREGLSDNPALGQSLILEIGEASAMQMPDVLIPFMKDLGREGITFTLDDFGAGDLSLRLLSQFRFDIAKLDGALIRNIDRIPAHQRILRAAIALAEEFGMFLVAEAVETVAEAQWLRDQGVGCLQGYLFGKPEVAPDFSAFRSGREGQVTPM